MANSIVYSPYFSRIFLEYLCKENSNVKIVSMFSKDINEWTITKLEEYENYSLKNLIMGAQHTSSDVYFGMAAEMYVQFIRPTSTLYFQLRSKSTNKLIMFNEQMNYFFNLGKEFFYTYLDTL